VAEQILHQNLYISVEHMHRILQHFEVESWSKQLTVGCHRCPAEQQYKLLLFKPDSKWQNSDIQYNFHSQSDLTTGATVPNNNDKSNDGHVAALRIEHNHTISDGAQQHCNIPYICFKPLALFSTIKLTK